MIPESRHLQVTGTGWCVKRIRDTLKKLETTVNQVVTYSCQFVDPQQLMDQLRALLNIGPDQMGTPDLSLRISFEPTGTKLIIMGKPDQIAKAQDILKATDVNPDPLNPKPPIIGPPRVEVYQFVGPDPTTVLQVVSSMLSATSGAKGAIDPNTGYLIVYGTSQIHTQVSTLLKKMVEESRQFATIPLGTLDPQAALIVLKRFLWHARRGAPPTLTSTLTR